MENTPPAQSMSRPGTLHVIPPNLCAFEPSKPLARTLSINTVLWIGGMFDTLGQVQYPFALAQSLPHTWSLLTAQLSSVGMSWGVKSIATDAQDMAKIISYIKEKRPGGKIVIMGHSTGCQDCMEYLVGKGAEERPDVDGIILQAPCSDRESLEDSLPEAFKKEADQLALKMCREGKDKDAMPNRLTKSQFGRMAITASRWLDISSPGPNHDGKDDYFSSDLGRERFKGTFGKLSAKTPLLVLMSGDDEFMPKNVNKGNLVGTWMAIVTEGGGYVDKESGIVEGASHDYNASEEKVVQDLVKRVTGFVGRLDDGAFPEKNAKI